MAASSDFSGKQLLTDIDDKVLLCAICMGRFKSPKILPCYHTFCEPCLTEWVKANNGQLVCPTCKKLCPLPSEGVRALDRNRFLDDLLGVIGDVRPERSDIAVCEWCEKEAKHWCGDCGGHFFCNNCIQNHSKLKVLKDHKPMKIEEYIEKMSKKQFQIIQPRFCDIHSGNKLEFFCDTCQVPTCYKCTVVEHAITGHRMISLESALEKYMPEMKSYSEKVAQKITNLKLRMDRVNDVRKDLDANRSTADLQIKTLCQKLIDCITNLEIKLHGEVDDIYMPKMKQIDTETELLEQRIASAENIHSYFNHLLTFGGAVDIMTAQKQMKNQQQRYDVLANVPYGDIDSGLVFKENPDCLKIHLGVVEDSDNKDNAHSDAATTSKFQTGDFITDDESDASSTCSTDTYDTAEHEDDEDVATTSTIRWPQWWPDFNKKVNKPRLKTEWSSKDTKEYRNGYPGKRDNKSMKDNLLFYKNRIESEPRGDLIDNIHEYWWGDYDKLERHHGYIEWIFPIREKGMNYQSQELQLHEAEGIKSDKKAWARVLKSYEMMLDFYGMKLVNKEKGTIQRAANWKERYSHLNRSSHNYLRITRILKSLGELGYEHLKTPFVQFVLTEALENGQLKNCVNSCVQYWLHTIKSSKDRKRLTEYFDSHYDFN